MHRILLLLAQLCTRRPARCSHRSSWRARPARSASSRDHSIVALSIPTFRSRRVAYVDQPPSDRNGCGIESIGAPAPRTRAAPATLASICNAQRPPVATRFDRIEMTWTQSQGAVQAQARMLPSCRRPLRRAAPFQRRSLRTAARFVLTELPGIPAAPASANAGSA